MLKSSMYCISPLEQAATCDSSLVVFVFVLSPRTLDIKLDFLLVLNYLVSTTWCSSDAENSDST